QFHMVVDLAVADDRGGAVFVVDWLISAADIDDGKARHGKPEGPARTNTGSIGSAVTDRAHHRLQVLLIDRSAVAMNHPGYSAHGVACLGRCRCVNRLSYTLW